MNGRSIKLGLVLISMISLETVDADNRAYVWTYEYKTMLAGEAELEYYATSTLLSQIRWKVLQQLSTTVNWKSGRMTDSMWGCTRSLSKNRVRPSGTKATRLGSGFDLVKRDSTSRIPCFTLNIKDSPISPNIPGSVRRQSNVVQ